MEKENVINKIRKLLKLQYGAEKIGSEGEAFAAAEAIRRLLTDYNLTLDDVGSEEEEQKVNMTEDVISYVDSYGFEWKKVLMSTICEFNFCSMYIRDDKKMLIIGAEHNVIVCREFFTYLCQVFRRLAQQRLDEHQLELYAEGKRLTDKGCKEFIRSYLEGTGFGLHDNYESRQPTSEETALVLSHQKMAEDYLHNKTSYHHQGTHKPKERAVYEEAFMAGFDDGLNVSLDKQIEGGKKPTQAELFK